MDRGELYLSEGYGDLEYIETLIKRNNNGIIIIANGTEYSQCK
jgi:hypothetical protein